MVASLSVYTQVAIHFMSRMESSNASLLGSNQSLASTSRIHQKLIGRSMKPQRGRMARILTTRRIGIARKSGSYLVAAHGHAMYEGD